VFEATVVEDRAYRWVERRVEGLDLRTDTLDMRISLGTPLLVPPSLYSSASARVETLLGGRISMGARERPRGGSPRALGGVFFDSFQGYIA